VIRRCNCTRYLLVAGRNVKPGYMVIGGCPSLNCSASRILSLNLNREVRVFSGHTSLLKISPSIIRCYVLSTHSLITAQLVVLHVAHRTSAFFPLFHAEPLKSWSDSSVSSKWGFCCNSHFFHRVSSPPTCHTVRKKTCHNEMARQRGQPQAFPAPGAAAFLHSNARVSLRVKYRPLQFTLNHRNVWDILVQWLEMGVRDRFHGDMETPMTDSCESDSDVKRFLLGAFGPLRGGSKNY
jgi:hypothetical protein